MKRVTIYVDEGDWNGFRVRCVRDGVSASSVIGRFIRGGEESKPIRVKMGGVWSDDEVLAQARAYSKAKQLRKRGI